MLHFRLVRERYVEVDEWLSRLKQYCPKKSSKKKVGNNLVLERMILSGLFCSLIPPATSVLEDTSAAHVENDMTLSMIDQDDENWIIPGQICVNSLQSFLEERYAFTVEVDEEIERVNEVNFL
jgi:hypothetical protein